MSCFERVVEEKFVEMVLKGSCRREVCFEEGFEEGVVERSLFERVVEEKFLKRVLRGSC